MAFSFCVKNRATGDFSKYCIVPCGKFGSPYPGKAQQPQMGGGAWGGGGVHITRPILIASAAVVLSRFGYFFTVLIVEEGAAK